MVEVNSEELNHFEDVVNIMMQNECSKLSKEQLEKGNLEFIKHMSFWNNELKTTEDFEKAFKKLKNEDIDPYERFRSFMFLEYANMNKQKSGYFYEDKKNRLARVFASIKEGNPLNKQAIIESISVGEFRMISDFFNNDGSNRQFKLPQTILNLLRATDVKEGYGKLPFNQILLTLHEPLEIDNGQIYSIFIRNSPLVDDNLEIITNQIAIKIFGIDKNDKEPVWIHCYIIEDESKVENHVLNYKKQEEIEIADNWCSRKTFNEIMNESKKIVGNLINFLNHPEVEIITKSNKFFRDNKLRKGKVGTPDAMEINLTGKLKRYVDETISNNERAWEVGHRFWVRGHWMEFRNERYKNKQGQKVWVLPYIKGKGELINKKYYVGEKEQCWENEKRMIKIVQQIFPDKKIEKHNRTILDGLEIDCYLPELKLGFEYNGQQHYEHVEVFHRTKEEFEAQLARDKDKLERAKAKGIKIISIKYDELLTEENIKKRVENA